MNNNDIFLRNTKSNFVKNLNASNSKNEAQRLQEKVKAYNNNVRSSNLASNVNSNSKDASAKSTNSTTVSKNSSNSRMTNELASKGLSASGVPRPIADAAVNSKAGQKVIENAKKKSPVLNAFDRLTGGGKKETEEQASDGGGQSFRVSFKFIKIALIASVPVFTMVIFICLFMSASQIYIKSIGLGSADSLSEDKVESKIKKKQDSQENGGNDLNGEITDENANSAAYISSNDDLYILNYNSNNAFMLSKLSSSNLVLAKPTKYLTRKYNEADLEQLEDFFPNISSLSEKYEENLVYDFFFKMYNLYIFYADSENYDVELDLPLLMATLSIQTDDMNELFRSNLSDDDRKVTGWVKPVSDYDYYKDWSSQKLSPTDSTHDMEILAQHMVSKQVKETCKNASGEETKSNILKDSQIGTQTLTCAEGETYETSEEYFDVDYDKYDEFLKEFIEKKYYINDSTIEPNEGEDGEDGEDGEGEDTPETVIPQTTGSWRNWKQCGGTWSKTIVPKSKSTMCSIGCLVTSITIQIARSGTLTVVSPIDPGVALNKFSFASGGNFVWGSTTNLAPNFRYVTSVNLAGMNKASVAKKLASYDPTKYYIVLSVSKKSLNSAHHYVALEYVDLNTNELYMIDPGASNDPKLYSSYKVYKARIFEKKD